MTKSEDPAIDPLWTPSQDPSQDLSQDLSQDRVQDPSQDPSQDRVQDRSQDPCEAIFCSQNRKKSKNRPLKTTLCGHFLEKCPAMYKTERFFFDPQDPWN